MVSNERGWHQDERSEWVVEYKGEGHHIRGWLEKEKIVAKPERGVGNICVMVWQRTNGCVSEFCVVKQ